MQVKVDGQTIEIFSGAQVKDVVRKYSKTVWNHVRLNNRSVFDRHGHEVGLEGELSGGEELFIRSVEKSGRKS